ncbi:hypothetical protein FQZ97_925470 [compost metagenome]
MAAAPRACTRLLPVCAVAWAVSSVVLAPLMASTSALRGVAPSTVLLLLCWLVLLRVSLASVMSTSRAWMSMSPVSASTSLPVRFHAWT